MFSNAEDEDGFGATSNAGLNLASLFGTSMTSKQNDNTSLVYTAPKPPKTNTEETPPKSTLPSSVITTAFVDAYSLSQDKLVGIGKCGLSLIGNQSAKTYEIILYKSKQDIICRGKLNPEFQFMIKEDSYASFSDDQKQEWLVHFTNGGDIEGFVEKIKKLGAKVYNSLSKAKMVEPGDAKDEEPMDTHSKANILTRMAKMGQPILPTLPSELKPNVTDSETDESETGKKSTVKKCHKNVSNSEDAHYNSSSGDTLSSKPHDAPVEYMLVNGQSLPVSPIKSVIPTPATALNPNITINLPHITALPDPFNSFVAENRIHNCELRMNITQLSSKLDTILTKLDKSATKTTDTNSESHAVMAEKEQQIIEYKQLYENLQKQNENLSQSCTVSADIIKDLQDQVNKLKLQLVECNENLENKILLLDTERSTAYEQLQTINDLQITIRGLKMDHTVNDVESNLLDNELKNLQEQIVNRNVKLSAFSDFLKQWMNSLYQQIMMNFEEEVSFNGKQIKGVISQMVKQSTLDIIEQFNKEFNPSVEVVQ